MKRTLSAAISITRVERRILLIRDARVLLDSDLAELYGVPTKVLNQTVSRNARRFPPDFMFRLTPAESAGLRSQFVTSNTHGEGAADIILGALPSRELRCCPVLRSTRAVAVNIAVMRAFVHLRAIIVSHKDLARRIEDMERRYDGKFATVFAAVKELIAAYDVVEKPRRRIGFRAGASV